MMLESMLRKSSLASLSPVVNVQAEDHFMALKVYFDGSWAESVSMTLAAIAADESVWGQFEDEWDTVLRDRGNPGYTHMKEAMPLRGAFSGWTEQKRDYLLDGLQAKLSAYATSERRFKVFTCTIDLAAHRRHRRMNPVRPEYICTDQVFQKVLAWYRDFPDLILAPMELHFDRSEKFKSRLYREWNDPRNRAKEPFWGMVRSIAESDMRKSPALQGADMVAWARNRLESMPTGHELALKPDHHIRDAHGLLAHRILAGVDRDYSHVNVTEMDLATK